MIRIELRVDLNYEVDAGGADFVVNVHAVRTPSQTIVVESFLLSQSVTQQMHTDPVTGNRYMRVRAMHGDLRLTYTATVELTHHFDDPVQIAEVPVRHLPPEVIVYIFPSRYCQSDRLIKIATSEFGGSAKGITGCWQSRTGSDDASLLRQSARTPIPQPSTR